MIALMSLGAIIVRMRQLITRIGEHLHRRLKERAAVEGRSMNAVVTDLLEKGLGASDSRAQWRARLKQMGLLYEPPAPRGPVPSHDEILARTPRAARRAVIEAFDAERKRR